MAQWLNVHASLYRMDDLTQNLWETRRKEQIPQSYPLSSRCKLGHEFTRIHLHPHQVGPKEVHGKVSHSLTKEPEWHGYMLPDLTCFLCTPFSSELQ